jgi:hypothetical protein
MSDHVNGRMAFASDPYELRSKYMAFRLEDGFSNGDVYDTKREAVRHVPNEHHYAFFCFRHAMGGTNPKDCQIFLDLHRHAYRNGARFADPDDMRGGPDLILSNHGYERMLPEAKELDPFVLSWWRDRGS